MNVTKLGLLYLMDSSAEMDRAVRGELRKEGVWPDVATAPGKRRVVVEEIDMSVYEDDLQEAQSKPAPKRRVVKSVKAVLPKDGRRR